jgi:hypothetical protein
MFILIVIFALSMVTKTAKLNIHALSGWCEARATKVGEEKQGREGWEAV